MNAVQGYGSDSEDDHESSQPVASGSRTTLDQEVNVAEDVAVDSNDVFGLNGVTRLAGLAGTQAPSSAIVRAAPEVSVDVSVNSKGLNVCHSYKCCLYSADHGCRDVAPYPAK